MVAITLRADLTRGLTNEEIDANMTNLKAAAEAAALTASWAGVTGKPATLAGYGITDAQPVDADLTAIAALAGTSGFLKKTAANTWALDTTAYITASASITGNAATATALQTARTINGVSFNGSANVTVTTAGTGIGVSGTAVSIAAAYSPNTATELAGSFDLNTLQTPGFYAQSTNADATSGLNYPNAQAGSIVVQNAAGVTQQYYTYNPTSPEFYFRAFYNTVWSPWRRALTDTNFNSYSPTLTGTGASGTWGIGITGNAATVTNGLVSTGSYADPAWLTSVNYSKLTGTVPTWNQSTTGSAATLTTGRTIALTGDVTYTSGSFNGSANVTGTATLAASGVTAGTYTKVTVDAKGRVTTGAALAAGDVPTLNQSTTGNAATATTLQTARTINGISFNGSANIKTSEWFHSDRDFAVGTLVTTDINYAVTNGDPFVLEIRGNSYGDAVPYDIQYQGYIYSDTIINHGGYSNGLNITGMVAINVGGNLCFWWPRQSYWNGFNVRVYTAFATVAVNRVTSITSTAKPTSTKEVALSANIRQSLHSSNYNSYSPTLTGVGASGSWGISVTGSSASTTGNAATATALQTARTINGVSFNGSANITVADSTKLPLAGGTLTGNLQVNGNLNVGLGGGDLIIRATVGNDLGDLVWADYAGTEKYRIWDGGTGLQYRKDNGAGYMLVHAGNYNSYSPTLTGTGASGSWGISVTGSSASTTGNAATATTLQTARTLTIGSTGKTFNGSANVAWSLAEIGALGASAKAADSELLDGYNSDRFLRTYADSSMEAGVHGGNLNGTNMQYLLAREQVQNLVAYVAPTSYETWNGSAWVSTTVPTAIFRNKPSNNFGGLTIANGVTKVRFTWLSFGYKFWSTLATAGSTNGNSFRARIYTSSDNVTWVERFVSGYVTDWPGYHVWPTYYGDAAFPHMRIELEFTYVNANACTFGDIALWGAYGGYTPLFDWDFSRNITLGGDLQLLDKVLRFDQSGTRSWTARATGGNLDIASGDSAGLLRYNSNTILHAGNYNSYSPTLTGTGASGSWGISVTGNAANVTGTVAIANGGTGQTTRQNAMDALAGAVTSGQYLRGNGTDVVMSAIQAADVPTLNQSTTGNAGSVTNGVYTTGEQTITARKIFSTTNSAIASASGDLSTLEVRSTSTGAAFMAFHRPTLYAAYFGLDSDNVWKVGGWSMGANSYPILHSNNYNTYAPTKTGGGASGSWGISITGSSASTTGNAATVTNGVYTTGSYADPAWLTSLASSKLTGTIDNARLNGGTYTINVSGSSGSTTGNAATATALQTARTINGVSFNGTANITVADSTKLALSGGTMTGAITTPNGAVGINIGDDVRFADRNVANTLYLEGQANNDRGYINFGSTAGTVLGAIAGGALTYNNNVVLHAGNYTSYSPSLTGSGASGSWGISVTGSAATLTTARTINGVSFNGSANITVADSTKLPLAGGTLTGALTIQSAAPILNFFESDQTLPAGRRRFVQDGNTFSLRRNTAAGGDFSTEVYDLNVDASGNFTALGNVTAYSDERVKENWESLADDFVDRLAEIKSGTFDRTDIKKRQAGVSAQSMQKLLPEVVDYHEKEELLSVAYGNAALVSAVELAKDNLKLRARVERLEALVEKLIGD